MKVAICTPSRSGTVHDAYAQSLVKAQRKALAEGIHIMHVTCRSQPILTDARNFLVAHALNAGADKVFFIDDDVAFTPEDFIRLCKSDKPVITGIYQGRNTRWNDPPRMVVKWLGKPPAQITSSDPIEVRGVGAGFLCVARKVFETIADKGLAKLYLPHAQDVMDGETHWLFYRNWFDYAYMTKTPTPEQREQLDKIGYPPGDITFNVGEDFYFCDMAREAGFPTYADPDCQLIHFDGCVEHNVTLRQCRFE